VVWHSVEDRVPFLENELIDFGLHLPCRAKYHRGRTKRLVHALAQRRLPGDVIKLPKIGFWVPDQMWRGMAGFLKGGVVADLLKWGGDEEEDLLRLVQRQPRFLFRLLSVEIWGRLFFRGSTCEQLTEELEATRDSVSGRGTASMPPGA